MARDISQLEAIKAPANSSSLVVAPPGYGKTYVMTRRILYLIRSGTLLEPKRLIGLTFTNAAAAEMRQRVSQEVPHNRLRNIDLGTIHSFCYQVLCAYGTYASINREFSIVGESERKTLLHPIALGYGIDLDANWGAALRRYNKWETERLLKNNQSYGDPQEDSAFEQINNQYLQQCHDQDKLDFVQILRLTYRLFSEHPEILELYRSTYSYILVDEFQDTNPCQFDILSMLIEGHPDFEDKLDSVPVFFFGDEDQAIYEFVGATPENVKKGALRFNCRKYTLSINHRTDSAKILELSSALRSDIETIPSTQPASLYVHQNELDEAAAIKTEIESCSLHLPLHRICVIAQRGARLQKVTENLGNPDAIPFVFIPDFSSSGMEEQFSEIFEKLRVLSRRGINKTLVSAVKEASKDSPIDDSQKDILKLLLDMARDYDLRFRNQELLVRANDFLNHILLEINWAHLVRQNIKDKLYVSTIHGVKGLEFDHVIICGLENYMLPHSSICVDHCHFGDLRSQIDDYVSEAKRLLYVGVTRSIDDISFYSVRQSSNQKLRKVTCLLRPLINHIRTDVDLASDLCGSL